MNAYQVPRILECTLRDGSYAVAFQFTEDDTRSIAGNLQELGFPMIEVGHGMGLGASEIGYGVAAETDETYLQATAETVTDAAWGMFCIPGIAKIRHVDMAADYGMSFIRIGVNVEDRGDARPFVEKARKSRLFVCTNFMKSYVVDPNNFADIVAESESLGSDLVYLVDSAGGMLPDDISHYVDAVRSRTETIALGFHGHHNLGLGVANSLRAIELGVEVIDGSLQGLGRSAGNTPTEQLVAALMRSGYDLGIDPIGVMDCGERHIQPLIASRGLSSVDVVAGLAQFHSSYMPTIERYATEYRVDPRHLIVAVCRKNRANAPDDLVREEADRLSRDQISGNWKPLYEHYMGGEQGS